MKAESFISLVSTGDVGVIALVGIALIPVGLNWSQKYRASLTDSKISKKKAQRESFNDVEFALKKSGLKSETLRLEEVFRSHYSCAPSADEIETLVATSHPSRAIRHYRFANMHIRHRNPVGNLSGAFSMKKKKRRYRIPLTRTKLTVAQLVLLAKYGISLSTFLFLTYIGLRNLAELGAQISVLLLVATTFLFIGIDALIETTRYSVAELFVSQYGLRSSAQTQVSSD